MSADVPYSEHSRGKRVQGNPGLFSLLSLLALRIYKYGMHTIVIVDMYAFSATPALPALYSYPLHSCSWQCWMHPARSAIVYRVQITQPSRVTNVVRVSANVGRILQSILGTHYIIYVAHIKIRFASGLNQEYYIIKT